MGHDPGIPEYDDDCLLCYAAGHTPRFLYAEFHGMSWSPLAGAHEPWPTSIIIEQDENWPCSWYGIDENGWSAEYMAQAGPWSQLNLWHGPHHFFENFPGIDCQLSFANGFTEEHPGDWAYGGYGVVSAYPDPTTLLLLETYNLNAMLGTKYEKFTLEDGKVVYMFANPPTPMTNRVLYDPT